MTKKPRIAFCFSGQARTLDQTYLFFQKNLFDAANEQGFNYDVFCAVEDDEDVYKINLLTPTRTKKIKSRDTEKIITQKRGNFIEYEYEQKYGYSGKGGAIKTLQQFYKIYQSIKIKNDYKTEKNISYDIVFKLRYDTPFARKLNFNNILKSLKSSNKILCNSNKLMLSAKFLIKIEDFYFIMNDQTSNILGNMFDSRNVCFKGCEIKHKKLNKIFHKIEKFLYKNLSFLNKLLPIPLSYFYSLFFPFFSAEIYALNYFKNMNLTVDTDEYITIYIIRENKQHKTFDFRTHTKKIMFKKGVYEL